MQYGACLNPNVGASLLAKNSQAPRSFRVRALSLTFFASKLAPTFVFVVLGVVQIITNHLAPVLPLLYNYAPCLPGRHRCASPAARSISVIHSLSDRF
ncbi:hypothetical protein PflCFBP13510_25480 [Pseudomonas fluorescens]|nr:hypothetical protein PflCFBP13510_25480 [Pseudomonas fluorescens]